MSAAYHHSQAVPSNANGVLDTSATTVQPLDGAPQGGFSSLVTINSSTLRASGLTSICTSCEVDATHAPMTVVVDPNAKPEKMPFKEQVSLLQRFVSIRVASCLISKLVHGNRCEVMPRCMLERLLGTRMK
jgi:hypothetical protein